MVESATDVGGDRLERVDLGLAPRVPGTGALGYGYPKELRASTEGRDDLRHDAQAQQRLAYLRRQMIALGAANVLDHQAGVVHEQITRQIDVTAWRISRQASLHRPIFLVALGRAQPTVADQAQVGEVAVQALRDRSACLARDVLGPEVLANPDPGLARHRAEPGVLLLLRAQPVALVREGVDRECHISYLGGRRRVGPCGMVTRGQLKEDGGEPAERRGGRSAGYLLTASALVMKSCSNWPVATWRAWNCPVSRLIASC